MADPTMHASTFSQKSEDVALTGGSILIVYSWPDEDVGG
jgi:hypothetical protein